MISGASLESHADVHGEGLLPQNTVTLFTHFNGARYNTKSYLTQGIKTSASLVLICRSIDLCCLPLLPSILS